ncbi:hypothetical protein BA062_22555 [Prauserella flavalba]|uniref:HTH araC/xylS-type domain-containing protein n=1 Tax=Prauserella flavalba TaxID=1477506 RepID=A0A318LKM6_9PSEU|nr:hypothetical protein BA062_22555 [Prauserella flavalba]
MERCPRAGSGSLTEIAGAVGLTRLALHDAFREHCGMTPQQYLRLVRLDGVRADLLAAPLAGVTIDEVALRWGFAHNRAFLLWYRERFGEWPAQTLRR